jgi:hypothetical protein
MVTEWALGDQEVRRRILVDDPTMLYDFSEG